MFNSADVLIEACVTRLEEAYRRMYGRLEPHYGAIVGWAGRMALENIANSNALYHDVPHTIMVTLVGQEILKGRHLREGGVSPREWLHFVLALLCHDIGYVRGVCREDNAESCTTGRPGQRVELPRGATDAFLTPYHIDRGKAFIRERFGTHDVIDADVVAGYIERTRFPVPETGDHANTNDAAGLLRSADLIGQLADLNHGRKFPALFYEFAETGTNEKLGYRTPDDIRDDYPTFYWKVVSPYIQDALGYLRVTQEGKQWIANLYSQVFAAEHRLP